MEKNGKNILDAFFSEIEKEIAVNPFYFENRVDRFRAAVHEIMVKEKVYHNPALDRNLMIKRLGVNKNLFTEMFRECFGMPFRDFVNGLRLKESAKFLEQSDMSIEKISKIVGFGTIRTFQRLFVAEYKMSPKDYRQMKNKNNKHE
ncbi:MAG: helix-turn-helix domain-containing protein [Prevotella sp.]|jgi:AraC-like DNA-binding protein|nr:helix-turn-helix domain-containing protein [Prevotella sp.]